MATCELCAVEVGFASTGRAPQPRPGERAMNVAKQKRVLVVDDDPQILDSVRSMLEAHGYEVIVAHDGNEGLVRAERDAPDLIILDVMMPRRSGFVVLERLGYRRDSGPKIIMMTASDEGRHEQFARARGADSFLKKPFKMETLLEVVGSLLVEGTA